MAKQPLSRIELRQGRLDLPMLHTLRWRARPGYDIARMIRARSTDVVRVGTGPLYPALHRRAGQAAIASAPRRPAAEGER